MSTPRVIYEDEHLLLVDKPAGWLTVPTPKKEKRTLHDWVSDHVKKAGGKKAYLLHRLDRETSGVIAFAKTPEVQQKLESAFRSHEPGRMYLALVQGVPSPAKATLKHHLLKNARNPGLETVSRNPRFGVEAITEYETAEVFGKEAALLKVRPRTGRTNQIRVQLAHEGHPLVGDRKYAKAKRYALQGPRTLLHAASLELKHPVTGRTLKGEAPLPEDFEEVLEDLRKAR